MNKIDFFNSVKSSFPEYSEMKMNGSISLVKNYLPKEYKDHSKNLIKEVGNSVIHVFERGNKIFCDVSTLGSIRYFHCKNEEKVNLFPMYFTGDSFDDILSKLIDAKSRQEIC